MSLGADALELPSIDGPREPWMDNAGCLGADTEIFFYGPHERTLMLQARALCDACRVRTPCLEYAIANNIPNGMWGGCTENERRRIIRRRGNRPPRRSTVDLIAAELREQPMTRAQLAQRIGRTPGTTAKGLSDLVHAGLVVPPRRQGPHAGTYQIREAS